MLFKASGDSVVQSITTKGLPMLTLTTPRHKTLIAIPGIQGTGYEDVSTYGILIDEAIDRLYNRCSADLVLLAFLEICTSRMEGYQRIATHLRAVTPDQKWLRDCAATELCRSVFELLQPEFDRNQHAIKQQEAEAEAVIAKFGYDTPASVTQTTLPSGAKVYGFRFVKDAYPGQVLKNDDHTDSRVLAVVAAADKR
jgi:hypothetical protein